jgi:hypothetical protein
VNVYICDLRVDEAEKTGPSPHKGTHMRLQ